jgi:hypothetical protein
VRWPHLQPYSDTNPQPRFLCCPVNCSKLVFKLNAILFSSRRLLIMSLPPTLSQVISSDYDGIAFQPLMAFRFLESLISFGTCWTLYSPPFISAFCELNSRMESTLLPIEIHRIKCNVPHIACCRLNFNPRPIASNSCWENWHSSTASALWILFNRRIGAPVLSFNVPSSSC